MKEGLTKWDDIIEDIVEKVKQLRSKEAPPEDIAKGLVALKTLGCEVRSDGPAGGKEYLRVRWSGSGERRERGAGPVDYEMRKILKKAGLYLEATTPRG